MESGFFAYGSQIASSGECIEDAIARINLEGEVQLKSWKDLKISGEIIISTILSEIDKADFFCADLTGMNDNVLFEVGYALAKEKPLYLILDTSHTESLRKFNELNLLTTVGYERYTKTDHIVSGFHKKAPYNPIEKPWHDLISNLPSSLSKNAILILNSQVDTNYNQEIINQLGHFKLPAIIDDASESIVQPISWYIEQLHSVPSALIQFSAQSRSGYETHNSKCALIAGMATGLELKVQMIAEKPYSVPTDYKEYLRKFSNRTECTAILKEYLASVKKDIAELLINVDRKINERRTLTTLQNINFGEAIAEHESTKLYEYFVDTHHTEQLIKNEYNIVVGRKGAGKTATLYYLEEKLTEDLRNNVILIKPINFEVDGLISLMEESNNEFEKGFLIETIWKFLIYSEIASYFYEKTKKKPLYALDKDDEDYIKFIESNKGIFLTDFSTRLEEQIKTLRENNIQDIGSGKNNEYRLKVSELLHDGTIYKMKEFFSKLIKKNQKLIVLIDNLDKSWKKDAKINILSRYLLGLLGVSGRISKELSLVKSTGISIDFHITIFLRSDIFKQIILFAREPDKIEVSRLNWEDPEKLFRIIEDRFVNLSNGNYSSKDLWSKILPQTIDGIETKEFIIRSIFPRPRDIIYFFKTCKDVAISRGHERIEEKDILEGYREYSSWVFKSVLVENGITYKQMEDFMYELMAGNNIISADEIQVMMLNSKIICLNENDLESFIDHLVSLTIIGRETDDDVFNYEYDVNNSKKLKVLASKVGSNRFEIHRALVPYLESKIVNQ